MKGADKDPKLHFQGFIILEHLECIHFFQVRFLGIPYDKKPSFSNPSCARSGAEAASILMEAGPWMMVEGGRRSEGL